MAKHVVAAAIESAAGIIAVALVIVAFAWCTVESRRDHHETERLKMSLEATRTAQP